MRAALLFIVFFLAHVGRSPAEAYSSCPGSCSALSGHGAGSYNPDWGYWKLEHDGGSSVNPNTRVVLKLHEPTGAWSFKGFIFKTSAGTLTVKDSANTQAVSACDGAIGHRNAVGKFEVEAYLDLPSTTGTVTVTAELVVDSKMSVSVLTMDIEVAEPLEAWTHVGNDIDGAVASGQLGYSVSMNSDGTRMAIGQPHWSPGGAVRVFQYDTASLGWQQMGADISSAGSDYTTGRGVSMSGDGTRVASIGSHMTEVLKSDSMRIHEWDGDSQTWTAMPSYAFCGESVSVHTVAISRDGTHVAYICKGAPTLMRVSQLTPTGLWQQVGNAVTLNEGDRNYASVALSSNGKIVVTSLPEEGAVQVYELDTGGSTWSIKGQTLYESNPNGNFGSSLAISADGSRIAGGAPGRNFGGTGSATGVLSLTCVYLSGVLKLRLGRSLGTI